MKQRAHRRLVARRRKEQKAILEKRRGWEAVAFLRRFPGAATDLAEPPRRGRSEPLTIDMELNP